MAKWRCRPCRFVYDEAKGHPPSKVRPGTLFKDLPAGWVCPVCGASKDFYEEVKE